MTFQNEQETTSYSEMWSSADELAQTATRRYEGMPGDEGVIVKTLFEMLPDGSDLISGSSMPIRDVDTFSARRIRILLYFPTGGRTASMVSSPRRLESKRHEKDRRICSLAIYPFCMMSMD